MKKSTNSQLREIPKLLYGILPVMLFLIFFTAVVQLLGGVEELEKWVIRAGPWAPVGYVVLKAATYVIAPLSGESIKISAGILFGFTKGLMYALLGEIIGGSINFWVAKLFGKRMSKRLTALRSLDNFSKNFADWRTLLLARVFLSAVYDFISYAAGMGTIPYHQYLIVSAIGGIVSTAFWVTVGSGLANNGLFISLGLVVSVLILTVIFRNHVSTFIKNRIMSNSRETSDLTHVDKQN